ncbi:DinB family protein [Arcicella aquatica]|uniref:DinB family protein n=1 Tax=Arcicella aquatica TaxID=217141 RepID=A0ABU5QRC1_9BACT|nr:DinB family protein [Arcicella aquatica]MEA5259647.1 DinB family protein [Arcicella aquatica]
MNEIDFLIKQTSDAYNWTNKLIHSISLEKWDTTPNILETNVTWQVGHLIMSHYYHSIMVIVGHQMDIIQKIPLKDYNDFFTDGVPSATIGKTHANNLLTQLNIVQEKSLAIIKALPLAELDNKLEPTPTPHPIAKTKLEALDWNIKHTMYHCGQIGILKRIIDERYDFGLRRNE